MRPLLGAGCCAASVSLGFVRQSLYRRSTHRSSQRPPHRPVAPVRATPETKCWEILQTRGSADFCSARNIELTDYHVYAKRTRTLRAGRHSQSLYWNQGRRVSPERRGAPGRGRRAHGHRWTSVGFQKAVARPAEASLYVRNPRSRWRDARPPGASIREENEAIKTASLDGTATLSERDLLTSGNRYFAVTGVTDGPILAGVHDRCNRPPASSRIHANVPPNPRPARPERRPSVAVMRNCDR